MQVLITGASGTIGAALARALVARGDTVTGVSRTPGRQAGAPGSWIGWDGLAAAVASADAVVHLAGREVAGGRWSEACKRELRASRIDTARLLVDAIEAAARKPAVLVSSSAVGYYGPHGDEPIDESSPPGGDFLATLCRDWEAAVTAAPVRTVVLRSGVVLTREGGALPRLQLPFRFFLGGWIGSGRQWVSWIHIADEVGLILYALDHAHVRGALNATAPEPVTGKAFSKALGRAMHRPALVPVPAFLLRLQLGEGATVLTTGQRVIPRHASELGYPFQFPALADALADLV